MKFHQNCQSGLGEEDDYNQLLTFSFRLPWQPGQTKLCEQI